MRCRKIVNSNKAVALLIVLATILVVVVLANIIVIFIASQARLTQHQVSRIRAYYAALAGVNYTVGMFRTGNWVANPPGGADKFACLNGCINAPVPDYIIPADPNIPYRVEVTIHPDQSGINNTIALESTAQYPIP